MDCSFINPLDLECLFINTFAGTKLIFYIVALLVIVLLAASFRMPNIILGCLILVFVVINATGFGGMYAFVGLTLAIIIGIWFANSIKK